MGLRFSFEVHKFDSALTAYETIETTRPDRSNLTIDNFETGTHFRTAADDDGSLILQLEDRLVTIVLDESGSMTWNDNSGDRYIYLRRLLEKLRDTYPGSVRANLVSFGGVPVKTKLLVTQASGDFLTDESNQQLNNLLKQTFQDSSHDFAGVRVVRRTDRFPDHPADGVVLEEGILDAVKDDDLIEGQIYFYGVWTFNKNLHFSTGQFVSGTPHDRILPFGVNFASANARILPGIQRQDNLQVLYSFVEGSGPTVFDSSGDGNHAVLGAQVIEDNFWLGDSAASSVESGGLKKPIGVRFDGEFDILEADMGDEIAITSASLDLTINFWIYRYANSAEEWIIGTSQTAIVSTIGWAVVLGSDGKIGLKKENISNASVFWTDVSNLVPLETWIMATITSTGNGTTTTHRLYINGLAVSAPNIVDTGLNTTGMDKLYIGAFPTDSGTTWTGTDLFGSITSVSISDIVRDQAWITNTFNTELAIFDQPLQGSAETPPDNTQREVLLSWEIEDDFNFAGGQVRIIRKYREIPAHQTDGNLVLLQSAEAGQFFFLDSFDFVNNQDYYYRIFTINALGNPCDRTDARVLPIHIPATPVSAIGVELSPVTNVVVTNGDRKLMLEWDNPSDSNFRGTRVYFGAEEFPTVSVGQQGELEISNGFEMFDSSSIEFYVHRKLGITSTGVDIPLVNATFHFYTIITYDKLGRLSQAEFATGIPSSQLATIFPPEEVHDVHLEIVNPTTLSIQWVSPIGKSDKLELFFGESALLFVNIRDIFGGDLEDLVNISLQVCTDIKQREQTTLEKALGILGSGDALDGPCGGGANSFPILNGGCAHSARFDPNCNDEQEDAETVLEFAVVESGLIKGILTHTPDSSILTRRERYEMDIRAQYRVVNPNNNELLFELNTEPVQVSFQHPLQMSLVNRQNRKIQVPCGQTGEIRGNTICEGCSGDIGGQSCDPPTVNGTHINATRPYLVRAEFQYKGEALPNGTAVNVSLFKSTENQLTTKSTRTTIREGIYVTSAIREPLLGITGNPTGEVVSKSIVDIEILAPSLPDKVDMLVSISYLGFVVDGIHTVQFVGSLFIEVTPGTPRTDGIDVAEQFVLAEQLDPDNPLDRVPVPDGTLIKWELVKLRFAKDRPFYSEEPINQLVSGVFSTTTGGIARNVFFGPIGNVQSHTVQVCNELCCLGEEYAIKASVILGEETAADAVFVAFGCQEEDEIFVNKRFFFNAAAGQSGQSPNYIAWGDGVSLIKCQIAKDPNSIAEAQIPGADCFRACASNFSGQIIAFPEGHIVQITAAGEILWDVVFGGSVDTASIETFTTTITEGTNSATTTLDIDPPDALLWSDSPSFFNLGHFNAAGLEATLDMYLRLQINVPAGHRVQSAEIVMTPHTPSTIGEISDLNITILDNFSVKTTSLDNSNSSIILGLGIFNDLDPIRWTPDGTLAGGKWAAGVSSGETTTPDLTAFIQAFIDQSSYSPGDFAIFKLEDNKPSGNTTAWIQVQNLVGGNPPELIIESALPSITGDNIASSNSIAPAEGENTVTAGIPITGNITEFYIRNSIFIGEGNNPQPKECGSSGGGGAGGGGDSLLSCEWRNDCSPFSVCSPTEGVEWTKVSPVKGTSIVLFDNIPNSLSGGGGYTEGMPPIMIGFKEPLAVHLLETRVNGARQPTQELDISGVAQHTFVVEITFGADENNIPRPAPNGTPVELSVSGPNAELIILSNCSEGLPGCSLSQGGIVFTNQVNDPFINPTGDKRSLAYFSIDPLSNVPFNAKINVTCRYDQLGTVERAITKCVELNNTINVPIPEPPKPDEPAPEPPAPTTVTSNEAIVYDTINDFYTTVTGGQLNRIGHFSTGVPVASTYEYEYQTGATNKIFIFGGFTDHDINGFAQISATSEVYDVSADEWTFLVDMPTARAGGMTTAQGNFVYCIGGLELDPISQQYVVSRKIEAYDINSDQWNSSLSAMPENYGVAFGGAEISGDDIYVTCGVTKVINNNQPETMNDRILRYHIPTDVWTLIVPSNLDLYPRLGAFTFLRSSPEPFVFDDIKYYIYGGSVPKTNAEINAEFNEKFNQALNDFRSFIFTSPYFLSLTESEQSAFIEREERKIQEGIVIAPFVYPASGFRFNPRSEIQDSAGLSMDISDQLDNDWPILPMPRDRGQAVYIPTQDAVYFMGGTNQNKSTTLNRVEVIDLANGANTYSRLTPFSRGRALFGAVGILDDIYLSGGLTSGHARGYVEINMIQGPELIEARGSQSSGVVIFLRDDAGELITNDIRCVVRGRLRIDALDDVLANFLADRAADRALGGDGSGNAPDTPQPGDEIDVGQLIAAQNSIVDPNSDQFQFNSSKKLGEQVFLFPVLYSEQEITISGGVGGVSLLPRSEDPLSNLQKLAEFIAESVAGTPTDPNERFEGDLTREELLALGDALKSVDLPPTILDSNATRNLYEIETVVTIIDDFFFGQTVSDFDLDIQEQIDSRIEKILTPPPAPTPPEEEEEEVPDPTPEITFGGRQVSGSDCFLVQHLATPEIPQGDQPPPTPQSGPNNPGGTGGFNQSGQCLFCKALLPLNPSTRPQLPTTIATFFNSVDWVPQLKQRLTSGNTLNEVLQELDIIDHETPFGASQLYSSMRQAALATAGDTFEATKKVFYVASDNAENYSLITRDAAIEEINAVDGDKNAPVVYVLFSTSFPVSIAAELQRSEVGDIEKITEATGGQSSTLVASEFMDQILNLTIGGATGGLGWGQHNRIIQFSELSAITDVTTNFDLPANTQGFLRFRHSADGFNFTDFTERFESSQTIDFVDFFAKTIEFEIVLTTGFTIDITEEYAATPTGIPKLTSITWGTSAEKEDFMFLNEEDILSNAQQVAASFEGIVPPSSIVEVGVASSNSHDWRDFQSSARPAMGEFGKTLLLERTDDPFSLVPTEPLVTRDGLLFKTTYGSWDPTSTASLSRINTAGEEVPVLTGFTLHPRGGEVYFDQRQPLDSTFKLAIVNANKMRVGLRLRNRLHTDSISVQGIGYIYSTNDVKPVELSQVAPRAINVFITPTNPTTQDTIFSIYDYVDLNGDPEIGTVISWFKNSVQLPEIQNETSWTTRDLSSINRLEPNDRVHFAVTPSDGRDFGTTVFSPSVTIVAQPPAADNFSVVSIRGGIGNPRFDTASTFKVEYTFEIEDAGPQAQENGTEIKWFVNGQTFKIAQFTPSDEPPSPDPRELTPAETGDLGFPLAGLSAHSIGNEIIVQVTPKTLLITGPTITSSPFSVVNSIPIVSNVVLVPPIPIAGGGGNSGSTLQVTYDIDDPDISDQEEAQVDQSTIEWLISINGGATFSLVPDLLNDVTVPPVFLSPQQQWKVQITPFDGLDLGVPVFSNTVTVLAP